MIAILLREKAMVSSMAEKTNFVQRKAFGCLIQLNNLNTAQAVLEYQDFKTALKELNDMQDDLQRKIAAGN